MWFVEIEFHAGDNTIVVYPFCMGMIVKMVDA